MCDIWCTSYSPGHNVHWIQAGQTRKNPVGTRAVQLISVNGNWFDVLIGGQAYRGWNHDAAQVHEFFASATGPQAGVLDPESFTALPSGTPDQGQVVWHQAGGGALTVDHADGRRRFLSVSWHEAEECHVNIGHYPDGSVRRS